MIITVSVISNSLTCIKVYFFAVICPLAVAKVIGYGNKCTLRFSFLLSGCGVVCVTMRRVVAAL